MVNNMVKQHHLFDNDHVQGSKSITSARTEFLLTGVRPVNNHRMASHPRAVNMLAL
jgi:hypothetical protein